MMDAIANHVVAKVAGSVAALFIATLAWSKHAYRNIASESLINVDDYVGARPGTMEALQCVLIVYYTRASRNLNKKPYKLVAEPAEVITDLKVTRRAKENETPTDVSGGSKNKPPLVIGTIRMGFGHHRIAYGAVSYGLDMAKNRDVYFHDILKINSDESDLIDEAETMYSFGSRLATEGGGVFEKIWGSSTKGGGPNALRLQCHTASLINSLMTGLDKNSPIVSTHPLVGAAAIAAGHKNVVNLVVDNHAQWFCVVPGALNLVQGPNVYRELLKMGVPEEELELVGHWCPKHLVDGIPADCERRIHRVQNKKPLRLLIPVGGAGAQKRFLQNLIDALAPLVKEGKVQLFLNAADHDHIEKGFLDQLDKSKLEYEMVSSVDGLNSFQDYLLASESNEPKSAVTLFAFKDKYSAVTATDKLAHCSDVLVCKPSEMAFYCLPKLMIRRVGDHEQKSAYRASEVGDGTLEARTVEDAMEEVHGFLSNPSVLVNMNKAVEKNNQIGIYDGTRIAVKRALERADKMSL